MDEKMIGIILKYCHELSRLVSPNAASQRGLISFDGATCDFLKDIAYSFIDGKPLNIENDEFYSEIYNNMKSELSNILQIEL